MERKTRMAAGTPAPYGRACLDCVRAKCKCITGSVGGGCERCHRLNKECRPSVTVRKKNAKRSTASRTTQLEEKLDSIVSLLELGAQSSPIAVDANAAVLRDVGHDGHTQTNSHPSSHSPFARSTDSSYDYIPSPRASEPSPFEAEDCLKTFRTQQSKFFPFIYIPSTTSAQQLLQERPFLWHCIMAISSKSTTRQLALASKIRHMLGRRMLLEFENNLDLLLGLLTYVGWANYHTPKMQKIPSLSLFTQLAISLVFDLGLNKPLAENSYAMLKFHAHGCQESSKSTVRTMEERRAVLGCFLVSSIISSFLQRIDALRWTPHMDECLETLAESKECPTDEILVQQVRLQLIVEKAAQVPLPDGEVGIAEPVRAPLAFYLKALQSQLQEVKHKLPTESQRNEVVLLHLHSTELTVNEIGFSKAPVISNNPDFQRLQGLYASLDSIKSFFDVFLAIPPAAYIGFPFSVCSQLFHCVMALYKLSTLDDPAWDKGLVRNTADLLLILNQIALNMRQVNGLAGLDDDSTEGNVFTRAAKTIDSMRARWEGKLTAPPMGSADPATQNVDEVMREMAVDFSDNSWWSDIFVSWDC